MKINFNVIVKDLDGKEIKQPGDRDMKMNEMLANALAVAKPVKPEWTVKQLTLALDIHNKNEAIEIDADALTILKKVAQNAGFSTLVGGQILNLLEPPEVIEVAEAPKPEEKK